MLQGMDLIFRNFFFNKTIVFTYPNASISHILQYRWGDLGAQRAPNQIDSDVTFIQIVRPSDNPKKGLKNYFRRCNWFFDPNLNLSYFNLLV